MFPLFTIKFYIQGFGKRSSVHRSVNQASTDVNEPRSQSRVMSYDQSFFIGTCTPDQPATLGLGLFDRTHCSLFFKTRPTTKVIGTFAGNFQCQLAGSNFWQGFTSSHCDWSLKVTSTQRCKQLGVISTFFFSYLLVQQVRGTIAQYPGHIIIHKHKYEPLGSKTA